MGGEMRGIEGDKDECVREEEEEEERILQGGEIIMQRLKHR